MANHLAKTTIPGYTNANGQRVIERTGWASTSFVGQTIYRMLCTSCGFGYGSNGCDIHLRRCPSCGRGSKGEPLREPSLSLF